MARHPRAQDQALISARPSAGAPPDTLARVIAKAFWPVVVVAMTLAACSLPMADTFTSAGVMTGARGDETACRQHSHAVWVTVDGIGDCVRYFVGGSVDKAPIAIVYFHGDVIWHPDLSGREVRVSPLMTPEAWQRFVDARALESRRPYMAISRPGVYGSSGDHKDRRLPRESALVSAALDSIRTRYSIGAFVLSGLSGGGHLTAALLSRRQDIACAVIASGVVAVEARNRSKGWTRDITGHSLFLDPIKQVNLVDPRAALRVFVLGDPNDGEVPFDTQAAYHGALRRHGVKAYLIRASGAGPKNHIIGRPLYDAATWCADGMADADIVERLDWPQR